MGLKSSLPASCLRFLMVILTAVGLALLVGGLLVKFLLHCPGPDPYLILLDAGSVHTSVYTYRYSYPGGRVNIDEVGSCELDFEAGVSSFSTNPGLAADLANHDCIAHAVSLVPNSSLPVSSILLGSTAGMRILSLAQPTVAVQIKQNLASSLEGAAHGMKTEVAVLDPMEEAEDGWVTANYLAGGLGTGREAGKVQGALDWGGASSQISTVKGSGEKPGNRWLHLFGTEFELQSKSHLCYGQAEAVNRHRANLVYKEYLASNRTLTSPLQVFDPCLPPGSSLNLSISSMFWSPCTTYKDQQFLDIVRNVEGNHAYEVTLVPGGEHTCSEEIAQQFNPDWCKNTYIQPDVEVICLDPSTIPSPNNHSFLAFSTYWYLTTGLGLNPGYLDSFTDNEAPFSFPMAKFDDTTQHICSLPLSELKDQLKLMPRPKEACFQANFMRALLTTGYHFDSDSWENISFVKRLGNPPAEVGWTLGHAIIQANKEENNLVKPCISNTVFVVLLGFSFLCVFFVLAFCQEFQSRRARESYQSLA